VVVSTLQRHQPPEFSKRLGSVVHA
jgi:hypothetical protein